MPNIYIIMGNGNSGKSRTIRALTGISRMRDTGYQIGTQIGDINVYVRVSSLQESDISPQDFIREVQNGNYQNVLVGLWINQGNGQPNGVNYIQEFLNAGWNINQIVILGANNVPNLPQNTSQPNPILNSRTLPSNTIASYIRNWWQWL